MINQRSQEIGSYNVGLKYSNVCDVSPLMHSLRNQSMNTYSYLNCMDEYYNNSAKYQEWMDEEMRKIL